MANNPPIKRRKVDAKVSDLTPSESRLVDETGRGANTMMAQLAADLKRSDDLARKYSSAYGSATITDDISDPSRKQALTMELTRTSKAIKKMLHHGEANGDFFDTKLDIYVETVGMLLGREPGAYRDELYGLPARPAYAQRVKLREECEILTERLIQEAVRDEVNFEAVNEHLHTLFETYEQMCGVVPGELTSMLGDGLAPAADSGAEHTDGETTGL